MHKRTSTATFYQKCCHNFFLWQQGGENFCLSSYQTNKSHIQHEHLLVERRQKYISDNSKDQLMDIQPYVMIKDTGCTWARFTHPRSKNIRTNQTWILYSNRFMFFPTLSVKTIDYMLKDLTINIRYHILN